MSMKTLCPAESPHILSACSTHPLASTIITSSAGTHFSLRTGYFVSDHLPVIRDTDIHLLKTVAAPF
ncbi:hypothetical protein SBA7_1110023 [Candidatus Sulfotelmatobacter sp. SbA7]|nr:hypothetical protein SBA7_1110023 [Candidatus Sulfotelmatobacter sp. SbA7]